MNDTIRTLQFEKEQLEARIRILEDKIESDNRQISEYDHELRQAKRLLKEELNDLRWLTKWHDPCELCGVRDDDGDCPVDIDKGIDCDETYMWRLETEVIKLIGGEVND